MERSAIEMMGRRSRGRRGVRWAVRLAAFALLAAGTAVASPPSVYHSAADDGVDPGGSVEIPALVQTTLHLYLDGGAVASSTDACKAGDGDEVCGWKLHIEGQGGLDLLGFAPTGDVVFALDSGSLLLTGGDPAAGTLGPAKVGDLIVEGPEGGVLELLASDSINASQTLEPVPAKTLVSVPEPNGLAMLISGVALLRWLGRGRSRG